MIHTKTILWHGFAARNHSWAMVAQGLCRGFIANGCKVDIYSTNGIEHFPEDLKPYLKGYCEEGKTNLSDEVLEPEYDLAITYSAMPNWKRYLSRGKRKFAIWCYEWIGKDNRDTLPVGWAKYHNDVDLILAPSEFARQIFLNASIPPEKVVVVPHGIGKEFAAHNTESGERGNK